MTLGVSGLHETPSETVGLSTHLPHSVHCEVHLCVVTLHGAYIPCCVLGSASISGEGPLSAVVASLRELEDDGTEGRSEESGAASTNLGGGSKCPTCRLVNPTSY